MDAYEACYLSNSYFIRNCVLYFPCVSSVPLSTLRDSNWYCRFICEETEVQGGGTSFSKSQYNKWQSKDSYCICFYARNCSSLSITPFPFKEIPVSSCLITKDSTNPYGIIFMQIKKNLHECTLGSLVYILANGTGSAWVSLALSTRTPELRTNVRILNITESTWFQQAS